MYFSRLEILHILGSTCPNGTSELVIYPNPAVGETNIESAIECNAIIMNNLRQKVYETYINKSTNTLNLSTLPKGMYALMIRNSLLKFVLE